MSARLPAGLVAKAMMRRVQGEGGHAVLLARGDEQSGSLMVVAREKGAISAILERALTLDDAYSWVTVGPQPYENIEEVDAYLDRRKSRDPDLWIVELDIAGAARFAAETG